jgi:very-short-patch-repair endonuclease
VSWPDRAPANAPLLASGDGSALGFFSAGGLYEIAVPPDVVHVIVTTSRRSREGIRLHRVTALEPVDVTRRHGMAVTTPVRTLRDLAAVLPLGELDRVLNEALVARLISRDRLLGSLARTPARPGDAALRQLLQDHADITRSEAERALKRLIRRAGIPPPRTNVRVAGYEVDCHWPELGLVVEVDGASFHGTPRAFQADRTKEAALHDAGLRLLRTTRWEVVRRPEATVARLARATAATAARLP